jgi:hypothetical protein
MHLTEQTPGISVGQRDRPVLTPSQIAEGERIFADWKSENWAAIHEDGALGDVAQLLVRLRVVLA